MERGSIMSKLNIELFRKIRERIAAIPQSYDQESWAEPDRFSPCGTVACLAGHAIICNAPTVEQGLDDLYTLKEHDPLFAIPDRAAELLGLRGSWRALVDEHNVVVAGETVMFGTDAEYWPDSYKEMFQEDERAEKAKAAVAYLDHIIETGKVLE
jgi:hypothetical protein